MNLLKQYLFWVSMISAVIVGVFSNRAEGDWAVGAPIVTYFGTGYSLTNEHAQRMEEGGWNLVWVHSLSELNVAYLHGLRAMWYGPLDDSTITTIRSHPALYSYFVRDEPPAAMFPEMASTVSRLRELDPNHLAYINLYPNYAYPSYSSYSHYLNEYINTVQPSILSYDHYQLTKTGDTPDWFKNLAIISHTAKQANLPFMVTVQSSAWLSDPNIRVPNGNELRYLYNTSLAYGAQGISDFVYYQYDGFDGGMVANDGITTTSLYDAAKTINPEFVAIAQEVQSMNHIGAYHLGDLPPGYGTIDGSSPMRLPENSPFTISGIAPTYYVPYQPLRGAVLGFYGSSDQLAEATCTLVVNLDYSNPLDTRVFGPGDLSVFDPVTGMWIPQGHSWADVSLLPGGSVLVGLTTSIVIPEPATLSLLTLGGVALICRKKKRCLKAGVNSMAGKYEKVLGDHFGRKRNVKIVWTFLLIAFFASTSFAETILYDDCSSVSGNWILGGDSTPTLTSDGETLRMQNTGSGYAILPMGSSEDLFTTILSVKVSDPGSFVGAYVYGSGWPSEGAYVGNDFVAKASWDHTPFFQIAADTWYTMAIYSYGPAGYMSYWLCEGKDVDLSQISVIYHYMTSPWSARNSIIFYAYGNGAYGTADWELDDIRVNEGLDVANGGAFFWKQWPGDANLDGYADEADYDIWAANYMTGNLWIQGDFNRDGVVDVADYTIWAANYTGPSMLESDNPLPEPMTMSLLTLGCLGLICRRRRIK